MSEGCRASGTKDSVHRRAIHSMLSAKKEYTLAVESKRRGSKTEAGMAGCAAGKGAGRIWRRGGGKRGGGS